MNSPNLAFMLRRQISQCLTKLGIKWSAGNIYRTFTMSPVALHRTKNHVWLLKTKWTPHTLLRSTTRSYILGLLPLSFFFFFKDLIILWTQNTENWYRWVLGSISRYQEPVCTISIQTWKGTSSPVACVCLKNIHVRQNRPWENDCTWNCNIE